MIGCGSPTRDPDRLPASVLTPESYTSYIPGMVIARVSLCATTKTLQKHPSNRQGSEAKRGLRSSPQRSGAGDSTHLIEKNIAQAQVIAEAPVAQAQVIAEAPVAQTQVIAEAPVAQAQVIAEAPVAQAQVIAEAPVAQAQVIAEAPVAQTQVIAEAPVAQAQVIAEAVYSVDSAGQVRVREQSGINLL